MSAQRFNAAKRQRLPRTLTVIAVVLIGSAFGLNAHAEPGWSPVVLPTGAYRAKIKSMPIHLRPYRPLHFYGNTVRRNYYQSNSPQSRVVVPREVRRGRPMMALFPSSN